MINRLHALVAFTFCLAAAQVVSVADDERPGSAGNLRDAAWFKQADKNGDGRLSREEAPNREVFDDVDTDRDGVASVKELQVWQAKRPQRVIPSPADQTQPPTSENAKQAADYSARHGGRAVLVMVDGKIVFERYDNGFGAGNGHPPAQRHQRVLGTGDRGHDRGRTDRLV